MVWKKLSWFVEVNESLGIKYFINTLPLKQKSRYHFWQVFSNGLACELHSFTKLRLFLPVRVTLPCWRFYLAISPLALCEKILPCDGNSASGQWKHPFWDTVATLLCYVKDQWNLTHCFSISGESYCPTVAMCKGWLCRRKEWNGCSKKQWVLGDNSWWAPKSCFSLVLLLKVNVGHGSNAISHSHSSKSKFSSLFLFHINKTNCFLWLV